jgi:hypothetical protein
MLLTGTWLLDSSGVGLRGFEAELCKDGKGGVPVEEGGEAGVRSWGEVEAAVGLVLFWG